MKVILYMATTLNGMIAKLDDDTSWISGAEWDQYSKIVRSAGHLIVGHRTYDILTKQPEFVEFKNVKVVVVATKEVDLVDDSHKIATSPEAALNLCEGAKEVVVAGGGILNAAFLEKRLVNEIYIDIEPIILGRGLPLFNGSDFVANLRLIDSQKIADNEIQLHFEVEKDK